MKFDAIIHPKPSRCTLLDLNSILKLKFAIIKFSYPNYIKIICILIAIYALLVCGIHHPLIYLRFRIVLQDRYEAGRGWGRELEFNSGVAFHSE